MTAITRLFADLTASLEDLHAIAVEGQSAVTSWDDHAALAALIDAGTCELHDFIASIRAALRG